MNNILFYPNSFKFWQFYLKKKINKIYLIYEKLILLLRPIKG
jgi:hypothetical protein